MQQSRQLQKIDVQKSLSVVVDIWWVFLAESVVFGHWKGGGNYSSLPSADEYP